MCPSSHLYTAFIRLYYFFSVRWNRKEGRKYDGKLRARPSQTWWWEDKMAGPQMEAIHSPVQGDACYGDAGEWQMADTVTEQ